MKTIAFISDDFFPPKTGVGVVLGKIIPALIDRGYKIIVLTSRKSGENKIRVREKLIIYRIFSIPTFGFWQAIPSSSQIKEILENEKVDLVYHNYLSLLSWKTMKVAKELSIPQVATCHMTVEHLTQPWLMRPFKKIIQNVIDNFYLNMDQITAPSLQTASDVEKRINKKVYVVTNPISINLNMTPSNSFKNSEEATRFLYVGRLDEEKNVEYIINEFALLSLKNRGKSYLTIVGDGRCRVQLEKLVNKHYLNSYVNFMGWVPHSQLQDIYTQSDIFILASKHETQGLVVMEALSYNLIVLVNKDIPAADFVVEGCNGFTFELERGELKSKIDLLVENTDLASKIKQTVASSLNWQDYQLDTVVFKYEQIFNLS